MKKNVESLIFNVGCAATAIAGSISNIGIDGNYLAITAAYVWQNTTVENLKNFLGYTKNYFSK